MDTPDTAEAPTDAATPPPLKAGSSVKDLSDSDLKRQATTAAESEEAEEDLNQRFSSRWAFWLSAIGCSVGYGNLWRFPFLVWTMGGGAFFIPYLIGLIFVTVPMAILEFAMGQLGRGPQTQAFGSIHRRFASIGWPVVTSYTMAFYPVLRTYSLLFFGYSMRRNMPWIVSDAEADACRLVMDEVQCEAMPACLWHPISLSCDEYALGKAKYFFETTMLAKPEYWEGIKGWNWQVFVIETVVWAMVCVGALWGARIIGYINYVLIIAPAVFLLIQVGCACSLPGARTGLRAYLGRFDVDSLKDANIWSQACAQGLVSLGVTQGTMAAYSSHNKRSQNFVQDVGVVAFGDTLFSIIAGLAIFAVAGYMSESSGIPLNELPLTGRALAFQTYPVGLGEGLPTPGAQIVSALFFLTLWLLGVSTFLGQLEAIAAIIHRSKFWTRRKWKKWIAYVGVVVFVWLYTILDMTDMAIHLVDCVDTIASIWGYTFIAGAEAIAAGWFAAWPRYLRRTGYSAVMTHMVTYIVGPAIGACVGFATEPRVGKIAGPVIGGVIAIGGFCIAIPLTNKTDEETGEEFSLNDRVFNLTFDNINQLRLFMNDAACPNPCCCRVHWIWNVLIKYIIPVVTTISFFNGATDPYMGWGMPATADAPDKVRYPWWVFLMGYMAPMIAFIGCLLFFFFPDLMDWLVPDGTKQFKLEDDPKAAAEVFDAAEELSMDSALKVSRGMHLVHPPPGESARPEATPEAANAAEGVHPNEKVD